MYAAFAADARAEGFDEIAALFEGVAEIEKAHVLAIASCWKMLKRPWSSPREGYSFRQCANCGHIVIGKAAPDTVRARIIPQAYFRSKGRELLI